MLTAYFDDSGTHESSEIVLVAGLLGTEARLTSLANNWRRHLQNPLDGSKRALRRFHMTECFASKGEFTGWTRTETDYFCHLLRQEIVDADVAVYGAACARRDWDELVKDDYRAILGSAEGFCIRNCFVRAIKWAIENTFDPEMQFEFDDRPSPIKRDASIVYDAFQKFVPKPRLSGLSFKSSFNQPLLQASDLVAWELYQYSKDVLVDGYQKPRRKELSFLFENMKFEAQIAQRRNIAFVVDFWAREKEARPDVFGDVARHFLEFDPANPDYSIIQGLSRTKGE